MRWEMSANIIVGYTLLLISAGMLIWFVRKIVSDATSKTK